MFESLGVINVWTYLVGLFFIIIAPGPNSIYVLRTAAVRGIGPGYRAALGVFVGDAILIFCAYLGIASLIRTTPLLFTLVRYLGAIYLLYLGVKNIHLGPTLPAFLSPNVAKVLVDNFGIAGIGTVEEDMTLFFGENA